MTRSLSGWLGPALARFLVGWFLLTAVGAVLIHQWAHIPPGKTLDEATRRWAMERLRQGVVEGLPLQPSGTVAEPPGAGHTFGPILFDAWFRGRLLARHASIDEVALALPLEARLAAAVRVLRADREVLRMVQSKPGDVRMVMTLVRGEGPVLQGVPLLSAFALVPLREGIVLELPDQTVYRTPDQLLASGAYEQGMPTPIPDLKLGIRVESIVSKMLIELGLLAAPVAAARRPALPEDMRVRRFLAETITRSPYPKASPGKRFDALRSSELLEAASAGASFLLRHQEADGRLLYRYSGRAGNVLVAPPNLTRHAGTTYFLAQAARLAGHPQARQGARRALQWLIADRAKRCGNLGTCIVDGAPVRLGATALTSLAAAEILAGGEDPLVADQLRGLTAFLRGMQRPDGEFQHEFDFDRARPIDVQHLYYSGEATFALLRAFAVQGDESNRAAAEAAMAHLSGKAWNFLGSRYYYGEEHWTCLAAGEAFRLGLDAEAALRFCERWAEFGRAVQYGPGDTRWDASGAYGVGTFIVPLLTPVASRTEAFISLWEARSKQGRGSLLLRRQVERAVGQLVRHSWLPGPDHVLGNPAGAHGGMPASVASLEVRNDFVQHAMSAVLRWGVLRAEEEGRSR